MKIQGIDKYKALALDKTMQIFDSFSEEKKMLVLDKVKDTTGGLLHNLEPAKRKILAHKIMACLPLFLEKEQAFEFLLLEAQDFLQRELSCIQAYFPCHVDDVTRCLAKYIEQLGKTSGNKGIVMDWFTPDIFTNEEWEQTLEALRAIRINWIEICYEYYQNDKKWLHNVVDCYSLHIQNFKYLLNMQYFELELTLNREEGKNNISEDFLYNADMEIYYIFQKYKNFFQDKSHYNTFLKSYIVEQQLAIENFIQKNESNVEIINRDLYNIFYTYDNSKQYIAINFDLTLQTGIVSVKLSSSVYWGNFIFISGLISSITVGIGWNMSHSYIASAFSFLFSIFLIIVYFQHKK